MNLIFILQDLIAGFDQEAAAVVLARLVSFKMETEVIFVYKGPFVIVESRVFKYIPV